MSRRANVLFLMTDQQRFDTIRALGNSQIYTPNLDRLVSRGVTFSNAYSTCPVCIPARYTIRTGCEPVTTGVGVTRWSGIGAREDVCDPLEVHRDIEERCGDYLPARMSSLGYRTFGVGKFHTRPWDASVGFEVQLHSEERYEDADQRARDAYASFIAKEHPEYDWIEALMGERNEMYYIPQMSPLPAELTVEAWAANRAVEQIEADDGRPWFGFVSFIGPHPPLAPPQPFNRMYDPDLMAAPSRGIRGVDHMDQFLPWMNHMMFAEDINDSLAKVVKARYYGEISYIDHCIGKILDALEARPDSDNTLICFFSDHGEHLGDHASWQKESFFECSARVPFMVSWPERLARGTSDALVCLTDLFGIATTAAGEKELREGSDVIGILEGSARPRGRLFGYYGQPGTWRFKVMVREGRWKFIYLANGGKTQLFDLESDPLELEELSNSRRDLVDHFMGETVKRLVDAGCWDAVEDGRLVATEFVDWKQLLDDPVIKATLSSTGRLYQFDVSRGVRSFPADPGELL